MTYNFDPERWLENQRRLLQHRLEIGEIDAAQYRQDSEEVDRRYEEMAQRLDGSYRIPGSSDCDS